LLVYFSEDFFHKWGRKGRLIRRAARKIGHVCISVYPVSFILLTLFGAISIFVPIPFQFTYWVLVVYFFVIVLLWIFEKITGRRGIVAGVLESVYLLAKLFWRRIRELPRKGINSLNFRTGRSEKRA
jgi:hypothetical protein